MGFGSFGLRLFFLGFRAQGSFQEALGVGSGFLSGFRVSGLLGGSLKASEG